MLSNQLEENKQNKLNLLKIYQENIVVNEKRKTHEKQKRIEEERRYIERVNLEYEEEKLKKQNQKTALINKRMDEYQIFMINKQSSKIKNRNDNVNIYEIKNKNIVESHKKDMAEPQRLNDMHGYDIPRDYNKKINNKIGRQEIEKNYEKLKNSQTIVVLNNNLNLGNYNSNNLNNNSIINNSNFYNKIYYNPQFSEYKTAARSKKNEEQKQYKTYLDSQVSSNRINRSQSSAKVNEYRSNPKKNFEPSINPFSTKNYEFGLSNLNNNPISFPINGNTNNKNITSTPSQAEQSFKLHISDKFKRAANNIIG